MEYQKKNIPVKDYEEFSCDTNGIVYDKEGKQVKPHTYSDGYIFVTLFNGKQKKNICVHKLIGLTFLDKSESYTHIDGNRSKNNIENIAPSHRGVKGKQIKALDSSRNTVYTFKSIKEAAEFFAESKEKVPSIQVVVSKALSGKLKTYKKYKWEYV